MDKKTIPAGQFKQTCLAVLDEVANTRREVVITKRGKPVARLLPLAGNREKEEQILASLRGRGKVLVSEEELLRPTTEDAGWNLGDDA